MKKKILFGILLSLLIIPIVKAANVEKYYEVCKQGCDFNNLDDVYMDIYNLDTGTIYDITVEFKDNETYNISRNSLFNKYFQYSTQAIKSTMVMKGTNGKPTITTDSDEHLGVIDVNYMTFENLKFVAAEFTSFDSSTNSTDSYAKFKDCDFTTKYVSFNSRYIEFDNVNVDSEYVAFYYLAKDVLVKNSNIKAVGTTEDYKGFRSDSEKTRIQNSTVNATRLYTNSNTGTSEISDSLITAHIENLGLKQTITNTEINGDVYSHGDIDYNNVAINTDKDYGIKHIKGNAKIYNSKISGAKEFGIEYITDDFSEGYFLDIKNTDLASNAASLHLKTATICPYTSETGCDYYTNQPETQVHKKYGEIINTWFTNSKIKSVVAENKGVVYIDKTNKLSEKAKRANSLDKGNIVELTNGKVLLEESNTGIINIRVDKEVNLNKYFEDLGGEVLGDWIIDDPSIIKIVNGKIVPLKVGTTNVTAFVNNTYYVLGITVTEDMLPNPETKDTFITLIALLSIISGGLVLYQYNKVTNKKRLN